MSISHSVRRALYRMFRNATDRVAFLLEIHMDADAPSTWIVPPVYEAMLIGFDAVEIGPRKAHLIKNGKRVMSCFYKQQHRPGEKTFSDWVTYITNAKA